MDNLRQRNQGQKKKNHTFGINISKMPKDPYTQQLQENPFPFNHNRFGPIAKPEFSNSSKTIKLYTQQENPLIKLIIKNKNKIQFPYT